MTRRLLLSYLAVTVLVLVVLGVPLSIISAEREQSHFVGDARQDALILAASYERPLELGVPLDGAVAEDYASRTGSAVMIADREGVSRLDTDGSSGRDVGDLPEIRQALSGIASNARHSETRNVEYIAMPITSGSTIHGAVRLALDHALVDARNERFRLELTALAAGVLGVAALIGWGIARSVSEPVRGLTSAAERFAAGELETRPSRVRGPAEVRALTAAMETMAAQLDELLRSQRRFVADASHQLRTPLTALRLRLGNALDAPPAERRAEMELAIEETDRVTQLLTSLLVLARADDHHGALADTATADLAAAVRDRVDTWSAVAESADVRLVADVPNDVVHVPSEPAAVEQIIDNLLDNALLVAPPHSTVTARVSPAADRHRLTVLDEGPGLADTDKQLAVQRFWRGDTSRPGTGLGLAIVDSLAKSSAATLRLEDAPGGGLAASVTFPPA